MQAEVVIYHAVALHQQPHLVLHPQGNRGHGMGLEFGERQVAVVSLVSDQFVMQQAGDFHRLRLTRQRDAHRAPLIQVHRSGPVAAADAVVAGDLEHQPREVAMGAVFHHEKALVAMLTQIGQQCRQRLGRGVRVRREVNSVGFDEQLALTGEQRCHATESGEDIVYGTLQCLFCNLSDDNFGHGSPLLVPGRPPVSETERGSPDC